MAETGVWIVDARQCWLDWLDLTSAPSSVNTTHYQHTTPAYPLRSHKRKLPNYKILAASIHLPTQVTMDNYPEVNIQERECASRHNSHASKASDHHKSSYEGQPAPALRTDSTQSDSSMASQNLVAEYSQYTDAAPPYSEKQYEGKSEEQQSKMRMADYTKELKRMMGRQLVMELKSGETKVVSS
jgi:hypothetical protein